jgi:hypothetical protein
VTPLPLAKKPVKVHAQAGARNRGNWDRSFFGRLRHFPALREREISRDKARAIGLT